MAESKLPSGTQKTMVRVESGEVMTSCSPSSLVFQPLGACNLIPALSSWNTPSESAGASFEEVLLELFELLVLELLLFELLLFELELFELLLFEFELSFEPPQAATIKTNRAKARSEFRFFIGGLLENKGLG